MSRQSPSQQSAGAADSFEVRDCALITRTANVHPALNLRELRDRLEMCPSASLYHHFCETKLRPTFDDPEYPNDFAGWAAHALRDAVLAERLGVLNPYEFEQLDDLRQATLDIIDDRLSESVIVPWSPAESQFHFLQAMTIVFDTGTLIPSLPDLRSAVSGMSPGSIYFHFIEARRRVPIGLDDFAAWVLGQGDDGARLANELARVDFYFLSLREIKERILAVLARPTEGRGS